MVRLIRRLLVLVVIGSGVAAIARWWSMRSVPSPAAAPQWPPFERSTSTIISSASADTTVTGSSADEPVATAVQAFVASASDTIDVAGRPSWVLPADGECPSGYAIKANDNSGIFHVPGGRFYERTKPERCYIDAEAAAADGYRAAKA